MRFFFLLFEIPVLSTSSSGWLCFHSVCIPLMKLSWQSFMRTPAQASIPFSCANAVTTFSGQLPDSTSFLMFGT